MISVTSTKSRTKRSARSSGLLVLEPPRHIHLPLAYLRPGKHLIGTADACGIRVFAEGVQPRHAMLLVSDQIILLKALDPRTWVNDGIVSEATLRPGDRISIGPITFHLRIATADELLDDNAAESDAPTNLTQPAAVIPPLPPQFSDPVPPPIPPELLAEAMRFAAVVPSLESLPLSIVAQDVAIRSPLEDVSVAIEEVADIIEPPVTLADCLAVDQPAAEESCPSSHRIDHDQPPAAPGHVLREIHRQIAILNDVPVVVDRGRDDARIQEEKERLKSKEDELSHLAEELSRQAQRLRDRHVQLTEREAAHERKQSQLGLEQERLVGAAQTTRRELAEEHARQKTLWQEWDAAYRRTADDLKSQLELVEQRRVTFQLESERLAESRIELQRLQEEFERDRRVAVAERVQTAKELGELHAERAAFEIERRQQLIEMQERETTVSNERHALALLQDELFASQRKIEHDRTAFAAERSADSMRREQEIREHTQARIRLNDEETSLHSVRLELEFDRHALEQEREALRRERDAFESSRADVDGIRAELSQVKLELDRHRQSVETQSLAKEAADEELRQLQVEVEALRRSKSVLESQLESERRQLQYERNEYDFERADVEGLKQELLRIESELEQHRQSFKETAQTNYVLNQENGVLNQEIAQLRSELDDLRGASVQLQSELDVLRETSAQLRSELESEHLEIQREREEFANTREEMSVALASAREAEMRSSEQMRTHRSDTFASSVVQSIPTSLPPSCDEPISYFAAESASNTHHHSMSHPMLPPPIPFEELRPADIVASRQDVLRRAFIRGGVEFA